MAKCLHQNTKAQSLIFCEPGKEGKDGNQPLPTSFPHLGQVTASVSAVTFVLDSDIHFTTHVRF